MKLLNGEIFDAREPLQKLANKELPVKVAYDLAKMVNKLNEELKAIDEVRNGLVKKYGEVDKESSGQISIKPESGNYSKFVEGITELMNQEVEVVIGKVKLPQEVDGITLQIEPSVLMALEKFIDV